MSKPPKYFGSNVVLTLAMKLSSNSRRTLPPSPFFVYRFTANIPFAFPLFISLCHYRLCCHMYAARYCPIKDSDMQIVPPRPEIGHKFYIYREHP